MTIVLLLIAYLNLLDMALPRSGLKFNSGWKDSTFRTKTLAWADTTFDKGWTVGWQLGQGSNNEALDTSNSTLTIHATFSGYYGNQSRGISGVMVQRDVDELDVTQSPILVIKHKESTSDAALTFTFSLKDTMGNWHNTWLYEVSTTWSDLICDLTQVYNGSITGISLRFTDDYDPNYSGGAQYAVVQSIAIYQKTEWKLATNVPVNADISSQNGTLVLSASGNLIDGTIVAAERLLDYSVNVNTYNYLNISIRTSSINIAARLVVWPDPDPNDARVVLLKTYNDTNWHTEIVDLSYLGVQGPVFIADIGFQQVYSSNENESIMYRDLSFASQGA
jgi:hypothetical protein